MDFRFMSVEGVTSLSHIHSVPDLLIVIFGAFLLKGNQPIVGQRWSVAVALVGIVLYGVLLGAHTTFLIAVIMGGHLCRYFSLQG